MNNSVTEQAVTERGWDLVEPKDELAPRCAYCERPISRNGLFHMDCAAVMESEGIDDSATPCPSCGSDAERKYISAGGYGYETCVSCGHSFSETKIVMGAS